MDKEYSNITPLIEKEENHLHNILPKEDVQDFKGMISELRDTWNKKQIFRTETEMRMSVLKTINIQLELQNTGSVLENKMFF